MRGRLRWLVLVFTCLFVLTACQTEAFLEIQVDEDGGGGVYVAVSFDQEAAARTVLFEQQLPVDDLRATGWTVAGPAQEADGKWWVRASKAFSRPEQLPSLVAEVAGADGPLRDFRLDRTGSFGRGEWRFDGVVDLGGGLSAFSDPELANALGGYPLGLPPERYAEQLGGVPLESMVTLNVLVDLPGEVRASNGSVGRAGLAAAPTTAVPAAEESDGDATATTVREPRTGAAVVWSFNLQDASRTELDATAATNRLMPRLWRWLGIVAGVVGALALAYQIAQLLIERSAERRRAARRPRPAGGTESRPVPLNGPVPAGVVPGHVGAAGAAGGAPPISVQPVASAPAPGSSDGSGGRRGLSLIIVETTGALLSERDVVGGILVPFVRERGCVLSARQIAELYLARVVGNTSPQEFWESLGITGDPVLLDDTIARRFDLTDQALSFLTQARRRGVAVAAVGDDVPEWIAVCRQRFGLDTLISVWVSSAEVGVRVPHPALLEAVERAAGAGPRNGMVIASTRPLLDIAQRAGYRTVHYNPGADDPDSHHPVLRSFADRGRSPEQPAPA